MMRKWCSTALLAGLLAAAATVAQAQPKKGGVAPKPRPTGIAIRDGLTMKNGQIILTELGTTGPITADKKLLNGTIITTTGLVTTPDGTATQLAEGDQVSLSGRVTARAVLVRTDSLRRLADYDLKYPGKREKAEKERLRKEKEKQEMAADRKDKAAEILQRREEEKREREVQRAKAAAKVAAKNKAKSQKK